MAQAGRQARQAGVQILVPQGDSEDGLWAIDVLDPNSYLYIPVVNYYHQWILQLKGAQGYTPGKVGTPGRTAGTAAAWAPGQGCAAALA